MASILRTADAKINNKASNNPQAYKASEKIGRVVRILNDVCSDPTRFVRIVRSQMGREEHTLFTLNQIGYRATVEADADACSVMQEYIDQERADGVPESISDKTIYSLWREGVSLGRIYSSNPFKLANYYAGRGKEGAKPYITLTYWAKALLAVAEGGPVEDPAAEEEVYAMMESFHGLVFEEGGSLANDFESVCPGFKAVYLDEEVYA